MSKTSNYERFLSTYSGQKLLEKHSLEDEGTWEVLGEDPNCDLGGHHYQPRLGVYTGKLRDVIEMAVEMGSFWTWGSGGDINPIKVTKVDASSTKIRIQLMERERALKEELEQVQRKLKSLY